jgi:zinc metalloprotease ZmpB
MFDHYHHSSDGSHKMTMQLSTGFLIATIIAMSATVTAQAQTDDVQYTGTMKVGAQGTTRALFNLSVATSETNAERAARSFLGLHKSALALEDATTNLVTDDLTTVPGGTHVRLHQTYCGLPVYGADVTVSVNSRNQVTMVMNNARGEIEAPTTPSIAPSEAIAIAQNHLRTSSNSIGRNDSATLVIFADAQGANHLSYQVSMTREVPAGDWEIIIDALSGEVLQARDCFVNYDDNQRVNGAGYVYLSDPLSAAHKIYGTAGFVDNNDRNSDSLAAYRTMVSLDSITFANGNFTLAGPFCTIADIESPVDSPYVSSTSDGFQFDRSQPGFEAANAYYHVSTAYKRLRDLGFASTRLQQIRIDPHGFQGQDNSHYSPSGNWISFGTGGVDDAEDADVIWHEYGHAIQYSLAPSWGGGEMTALGEGYSDYWAASYAHSLNQWTSTDDQFAWVYKWDGHNSYWAGRRLDDSRTYPFDNLSPHVAGQIWSSALMEIWKDLGRDITDRIVLKSLCYLTYGSTAVDAAHAVLQADRDLYNGIHTASLVYWLGTVKHFLDSETIKSLATGVDDSNASVPAAFGLSQNYPNPFNPTTTIPFAVSGRANVRITVYTMIGQEVRTLVNGAYAAGTFSVVWDGTSSEGKTLASGVYLCRFAIEPLDGSAPQSMTRKMALVR